MKRPRTTSRPRAPTSSRSPSARTRSVPVRRTKITHVGKRWLPGRASQVAVTPAVLRSAGTITFLADDGDQATQEPMGRRPPTDGVQTSQVESTITGRHRPVRRRGQAATRDRDVQPSGRSRGSRRETRGVSRVARILREAPLPSRIVWRPALVATKPGSTMARPRLELGTPRFSGALRCWRCARFPCKSATLRCAAEWSGVAQTPRTGGFGPRIGPRGAPAVSRTRGREGTRGGR